MTRPRRHAKASKASQGQARPSKASKAKAKAAKANQGQGHSKAKPRQGIQGHDMPNRKARQRHAKAKPRHRQGMPRPAKAQADAKANDMPTPMSTQGMQQADMPKSRPCKPAKHDMPTQGKARHAEATPCQASNSLTFSKWLEWGNATPCPCQPHMPSLIALTLGRRAMNAMAMPSLP
ncbi:hypothetical protein GBA52_024591 [Prunus armeniaca]|nr:hypothetical protein GBA52_024591 [Prunus armeniaca]